MIPDIVEIRRLCASGQWFAKIENGRILLHDTVAGETVCIGQADANPVRHGKYEFVGMDMLAGTRSFYFGTCSECKERINFASAHKNFCPNCGAKMNKEE